MQAWEQRQVDDRDARAQAEAEIGGRESWPATTPTTKPGTLLAARTVMIGVKGIDVRARDLHWTIDVCGSVSRSFGAVNVTGNWYASAVVRIASIARCGRCRWGSGGHERLRSRGSRGWRRRPSRRGRRRRRRPARGGRRKRRCRRRCGCRRRCRGRLGGGGRGLALGRGRLAFRCGGAPDRGRGPLTYRPARWSVLLLLGVTKPMRNKPSRTARVICTRRGQLR